MLTLLSLLSSCAAIATRLSRRKAVTSRMRTVERDHTTPMRRGLERPR